MIIKLMEEADEECELGAGELQSWNKQAMNLMPVSSREHSEFKTRAKRRHNLAGLCEDMRKEIGQKEDNKTYNGDEAICNVNMEKYKGHNADESQTFIMGPKQFSDLTLDEFDALATFGFTKLGSGLANLGVHVEQGVQ